MASRRVLGAGLVLALAFALAGLSPATAATQGAAAGAPAAAASVGAVAGHAGHGIAKASITARTTPALRPLCEAIRGAIVTAGAPPPARNGKARDRSRAP